MRNYVKGLMVGAATVAAIGLASAPASAADYLHKEFQNTYSGLCLGIGSQPGNGAPAIQWGCNSSAQDEHWSARHDSAGYLVIQNYWSGKCLGVGSSHEWNAHVIQYTCNGASDEQWDAFDNVFHNVYSGLCIGVASSTTPGSNVVQYPCNDASDEHWPFLE